MAKILIVEDEAAIADIVAFNLRREREKLLKSMKKLLAKPE